MRTFSFAGLHRVAQLSDRTAKIFALLFGTLVLVTGGCAMQPETQTEVSVPVTAVLDPTSRLYQRDQIVVIGYLRCFDELTRLYSTFDEANRASLLNSITIVKPDETSGCPGAGEIELAYCSYRGHMSLPDQYSAPRLVVDDFLDCSNFDSGEP